MPGKTFHVREATEADAVVLAAMGVRTFRAAFGADNDPADIEHYVAAAFSVAQIAAELRQAGSIFLLAYDDDFSPTHPVGYARLLSGPAHASVGGPDPVQVVRFYVEPEAVGRGYGAALMQACLDQARQAGFQTLWLGVWERNAPARRFYERWGFRRVGALDFQLGSVVQTDLMMQRPVHP
jgi:GNAT superfamily N-acetyltransferase